MSPSLSSMLRRSSSFENVANDRHVGASRLGGAVLRGRNQEPRFPCRSYDRAERVALPPHHLEHAHEFARVHDQAFVIDAIRFDNLFGLLGLAIDDRLPDLVPDRPNQTFAAR